MKKAIARWALILVLTSLLTACWVQGGLLTESTGAELVISWEREGGIMGFCDEVLIYDDGTTVVSTCRLSDVQVRLTNEEAETVVAWQRAYRSAEASEGDLDLPDGMRETLQFYGQGDAVPSEAQLLVMEQFAIGLLARGAGNDP